MILEEKSALSDEQLFPDFLKMCRHPQEAQEEILRCILKMNKDTAFGRKYRFSEISSISDFQERIPVLGWEDFQPMSQKMEQGQSDQLFAGQPDYFIVTSGTTGQAKYLPESNMGAKAKSLTSRLRRISIAVNNPTCLSGQIFPISNSAGIGTVECGIPYGYASGVTLMETPEQLRLKIAYPLELLNIQDQNALDYALMRFAIEQNVTAIIANNAGRVEKLILMAEKKADDIINDIQNGTLSLDIDLDDTIKGTIKTASNPKRAEELRSVFQAKKKFSPSVYWPELSVFSCWMGGSMGRYLQPVKPHLGNDVEFVDFGYGASEGKFNIPLQNNQVSGPISLLGAFYEFESLEEDEKIFQIDELQDGKQYKLIITTFSGLYRYDLKDIIEVDGFTYNTPNIHFVNKTKDVGNICGEKLSAQFIIQVIERLSSRYGLKVKHFCAVADCKDQRYDFCMELESETTLDSNFAQDFDSALNQVVVYAAKRRQQLLGAPRIVIMENGWQEALYAQKAGGNVSIAQIKLPVIYEDIPLHGYIREILGE